MLLFAVWLVLPLGGCKLADHAGESDWLALCDCQWPLALCQWASSFGGVGLRGSPSSESSGVVFLLVGVPALCPVDLSVPAHWQWQRRRPARCGGSRDPRIWRRLFILGFRIKLSYFRTQSVQGGPRRAPLVVTIFRRPLYFERWNAASMQHGAVTAADLEHCRRRLLEAASHCSSCGA